MKKIIITLSIFLSTAGIAYAATFNSAQVGSNPVNNYILQTNGSISSWVPNSGGSSSPATSTNPLMATYFVATSTTATSTFAGPIKTPYLNLTSTTASTTAANGINLSAGCFAINGVCVTGSGGSSSVGPLNVLQASNGAGGFLATGTPNLTAGLFTATSTTATSTFIGNMAIGSTTNMFSFNSLSDTLSVRANTNPGQGGVNGKGFTLAAIDPTPATLGCQVAKIVAQHSPDTNDYAGWSFYGTDDITNGCLSTPVHVADMTGYGDLNVNGFVNQGYLDSGLTQNRANSQFHYPFIVGDPTIEGSHNDLATMLIMNTQNIFTSVTPPNAIQANNSSDVNIFSVSGLGFGTTTVAGLKISGSASSTSNVGFNLTAGCFAINSVCVGGGGSGSGTVNTGVFGQVAYYGANGTILSGTSTLVLGTTTIDANNVGIGSTTPIARLSVTGLGTGTGNTFIVTGSDNLNRFKITDNGNVSITGGTFTQGSSGQASFSANGALTLSNGLNVQNAAATFSANNATVPVNIQGGASQSGDIFQVQKSTGSSFLNVTAGGNVGIGTTSPYDMLSIAGEVAAKNYIATSTTATSTFAGDVTVGSGSVSFICIYAGNCGFGTTTPYATLSVQALNSITDIVAIATSTGAPVAGYDSDGHPFTSGPAPTVSSCGTGSPTIVGDDRGGTITTGTAATACTLTFSKAWQKTPYPQGISDNSATIVPSISSISTTAVTFGLGAGLSGGQVYYSFNQHK